MKRLNTERQLPLSIILGDINGLKLLNDSFSHLEGDSLIVEMASISLRELNIAQAMNQEQSQDFQSENKQ